MITAVLDTNVLASGFVRSARSSPTVLLLDHWRAERFALVVSEHILAELAATFASPYFRQRLTREQAHAVISLLKRAGLVVPITVQVHGVATHPEDDLILATALSARADYLVTGDGKLRKLSRYRGVEILSAGGFLNLLSRSSGSQ